LALIKKIRNRRSGKIKEKIVSPSINPEGYLYYNLTSDSDLVKKTYNIYVHRLFGMVFNDNNDIFRNTDCDHIDRFRWCNKPENTAGLHQLKIRITGVFALINLIENMIKVILPI
jgi:hypothetical protein